MMNRILLAATIGALSFAGSPQVDTAAPRSTPPAAWADSDPADSLYRDARRALTQKDYGTAARLFDAIVSRFPRSEYAPDALYWKGFALYRNGDLDHAAESLEAQAKRYPSASTRSDAGTLLILVKGELAKRGDASARRDVAAAANPSQGASCGDLEMQIAALDALQQMDADRATPLLKKVLARRDACSVPLRKNALFVLSQRSGADRERLLLDVAKSDPAIEVRQEAVFHLSQAKSGAAVDALEDLLKNGEPSVRSNALFALASNGSDRSRAVVKALVLNESTPEALRKDAIFHLASIKGDDGVSWLRDNYSKVRDQKLRGEIMFHIASHPSVESTKWLNDVAMDPNESMPQRTNAIFHLSSSKASVGVLAALYDRVPMPLKKDVLFHIASHRDAAALDKIISIAKTDTSMAMRKEALFHIGQSKDPRALKALEEIVSP